MNTDSLLIFSSYCDAHIAKNDCFPCEIKNKVFAVKQYCIFMWINCNTVLCATLLYPLHSCLSVCLHTTFIRQKTTQTHDTFLTIAYIICTTIGITGFQTRPYLTTYSPLPYARTCQLSRYWYLSQSDWKKPNFFGPVCRMNNKKLN